MSITYIKAEKLSYDAVFHALKNHDVYASWGPEIKDICFDPKQKLMEVECSDAREIFLMSERRFADHRIDPNGHSIAKAAFDLKAYLEDTVTAGTEKTSFVRLVVVDWAGKKAVSRGYFADELLNL